MSAVFPIAFLDPPYVFSAYVTNIPGSGSAPIQVVADIGFSAPYALQYSDTTGDWIGVYTGPAGSEVLRTIIGNGLSLTVPLVIAAHSRVSLRSMTATPITNGQVTIVFLGFKPN